MDPFEGAGGGMGTLDNRFTADEACDLDGQNGSNTLSPTHAGVFHGFGEVGGALPCGDCGVDGLVVVMSCGFEGAEAVLLDLSGGFAHLFWRKPPRRCCLRARAAIPE